MTEYALVNPEGQIIGRAELASSEDVPVLAPNKGRWLPVVVSGETYDPVSQVRTGPTETVGDAVVTRAYAIRAKTLEEVALMRADKVSALKAEATVRIEALYPDWKQRNMTARGVELLNIKGSRALTTDEQAESDALMASWSQVKAIRAKSDQLEASIPQDAAGIAAFDVTQGWG